MPDIKISEHVSARKLNGFKWQVYCKSRKPDQWFSPAYESSSRFILCFLLHWICHCLHSLRIQTRDSFFRVLAQGLFRLTGGVRSGCHNLPDLDSLTSNRHTWILRSHCYYYIVHRLHCQRLPILCRHFRSTCLSEDHTCVAAPQGRQRGEKLHKVGSTKSSYGASQQYTCWSSVWES